LGELVKDPKTGLDKVEWSSSMPVTEDFGRVENKRRSSVRNSTVRNPDTVVEMSKIQTIEPEEKLYPPLGNLPWNFKN
jgi:hypothetical protein